MPKVSIIVPAYNAEDYIEKCISSILAQTLKDIEIIIIDDGSTDKTGILLDKICGSDNRIRLYHQENKGLYATRKIGLNKAAGEFVGWVDADDFIDPEMYEILYNTAKENNSDLCYCDYKWFPQKAKNKEKWFRDYNGEKTVAFLERNSQPWNKIVKRELLERLNIADKFEKCFDEIYIELLLESANPVSVRKELYNYRVQTGTMSGSYNNVEHYISFVSASIELKNEMLPLLHNNKYWEDYFEYRIIYYRLITMLVAARNNQREEYKNQRNLLFAERPFYTNQHFWHIMVNNNGFAKAAVLGIVVPGNYSLANILGKLAL